MYVLFNLTVLEHRYGSRSSRDVTPPPLENKFLEEICFKSFIDCFNSLTEGFGVAGRSSSCIVVVAVGSR